MQASTMDRAGERAAGAAEWVRAYIDAIVKATRGETAGSAAYSRGVALAVCPARADRRPEPRGR
ncbi:MAG: hypothetical protein K2Q09_00725 [Phycisphaerales bacterium]|nr:hypothetical protein [Phycisphaerales bacterium]